MALSWSKGVFLPVYNESPHSHFTHVAIFSHVLVPESLSRSSTHLTSFRDTTSVCPRLSSVHVYPRALGASEKRLPSVSCVPQGRKPEADSQQVCVADIEVYLEAVSLETPDSEQEDVCATHSGRVRRLE